MTAIAMYCGLVLTASTATTPKDLVVEVRICKGDPLGSHPDGNISHLAEKTQTVPCGRAVVVRAGGEVPILMHGKAHYVFLGTEVDAAGNAQAGGKVFSDVHIAYSPHESGNGRAALNGGFGKRVTRLGKLGETVKVRISANDPKDQVWVELTIRAASTSSR